MEMLFTMHSMLYKRKVVLLVVTWLVFCYSGAPKVPVTRAMKHLQEITESGQEITLDEPITHLDYSAEKTPIEWSSEGALNEKYSFVSELARYVITLYNYSVEYVTYSE